MARPKGEKKVGGRKKGTPNKVTTSAREGIAKLLNVYYDSGLMSEDFASLEPKERIDAVARLAPYVMPRMQATAIDVSSEATASLAETLASLACDDN
ncbi:hypothetical protein [Paramuribaculum intestinale]|uniref:hypothetical protein n=1 Tax=Paramuribaculum intestinale TaxID=2094151 RepID=UPI0025AF0885|nr:hypothetical protein [Paramuribaculum intestinale]